MLNFVWLRPQQLHLREFTY